MVLHRYISILILLFTFQNIAFANPQQKIDSLSKLMSNANDSQKSELCYQMAVYASQIDVPKANVLIRESYKYAQKAKNEMMIERALVHLSINNQMLGNSSDALDTISIAVRMIEKNNNKVELVYAYGQKAAIFQTLNKYDSANVYFLKSLSMYKEAEIIHIGQNMNKYDDSTKKEMRRLLIVYGGTNLDYGMFLINTVSYDGALHVFERAYKAGEFIDHKILMCGASHNIGLCYKNMFKYKEAESYFLKSLKLAEITGHQRYLGIITANLGVLYSDMKKYVESDKFYKRSLMISEKTGYALSIIDILTHYADLKLVTNNLNEAKSLAERGLKLATKLENLMYMKDNNVILAKIAEKQKDYKTSIYYMKAYVQLYDSLNTLETEAKITEAMIKYQSELKEKENELLLKENTIKKSELANNAKAIKISYIIIALIAAFMVLLLISLRYRIIKNNIIKKQNLELQKQTEELTELNDTKDKFFSIMAHDLKNPVSTFKTITEMLSTNSLAFSDAEKNELLVSMTASAKHLLVLLDNLLTWSRSQTGKIVFSPEYVNLKDILDNSIALLHNSAINKSIELVNFVKDDIKLFADANMLATVIRNLVSNAVKFTPEGGKVSLNTEIFKDKIRICIKDTGVGMNAEQSANLFMLSTNISTKGTRNETGTGLGLIICKEFIDKHSGSISVESKIGEGTIFLIDLPISMN